MNLTIPDSAALEVMAPFRVVAARRVGELDHPRLSGPHWGWCLLGLQLVGEFDHPGSDFDPLTHCGKYKTRDGALAFR